MRVTALARVGRNVRDLAAAAAFYAGVLGFEPLGSVAGDSALAACLGVEQVLVLRLRLGAQEIELSECQPVRAAFAEGPSANDLAFQHIAIITADIASSCAALARHGVRAISHPGPVQLPAASGGVTAFKFRDPDGHGLELLQFPAPAGRAVPGYDHSAISVADIGRSAAFYGALGLLPWSRQLNRGPGQDVLDGLHGAAVDVAALRPLQGSPHVELLGYRHPKPPPATPFTPGDIYADRLVFTAIGAGLQLRRDPDGHVIMFEGG